MKKIWKRYEKHMSPIIVAFSICTVMTFTVINILFASHGVSISDTLTEWVFKFFGLEMLALSGIKISKHIGSAFGRAEDKIDGTEGDD